MTRRVSDLPDMTAWRTLISGEGTRDDDVHMPNYRRVWVAGGTYFFTVALKQRARRLLVEHIESLRMAFRVAADDRPFGTLAAVVLPEHLHCIWRLPAEDADYATRWRHVKSLFSSSLPSTESRSGCRVLKGERGIWQRRYWGHLIRDERDLAVHIDYVHYNPVKHGHVARVCDWPYSTFHRYVREGVLATDWAGDAVHGDFGETQGGS